MSEGKNLITEEIGYHISLIYLFFFTENKVCSYTVEASSGTIDFTQIENNQQCIYTVIVPVGRRVRLEVGYQDFEALPDDNISFYFISNIYAEGYIVFAFPFVCSSVCSFIRLFFTFRRVRRIYLKVFG